MLLEVLIAHVVGPHRPPAATPSTDSSWGPFQGISLLIAIHAVCGGVALLCGPGALIAMKGGRLHRGFGIGFFYSMMLTSVLALIISNLPDHKNFFLFMIGIFSIYMISSGLRYLSLRKLYKGQSPETIDWILTLLMLLFGSILFIGGIIQLVGLYSIMGNNYFGIVMIVFGAISLSMVRQDIRNYSGNIKYRNQYLQMHIIRMVGANIAAFTAFLVVNNHSILPNLVAWLLPTAIGAPIISYWVNKQKKVQGAKIERKS
jgi:uncharacterized membrane protein